jgi:hypothetical protein
MDDFGAAIIYPFLLVGLGFFMWRTARWVRFATNLGADTGFFLGFFLALTLFCLISWLSFHLLNLNYLFAYALGVGVCVLTALAMWKWEEKHHTLHKSAEDTYPYGVEDLPKVVDRPAWLDSPDTPSQTDTPVPITVFYITQDSYKVKKPLWFSDEPPFDTDDLVRFFEEQVQHPIAVDIDFTHCPLSLSEKAKQSVVDWIVITASEARERGLKRHKKFPFR